MSETETRSRVPVDRAALAAFCQRNHIRRLSLFGSVLRDDFGPDSDVDVLVEFEPPAVVSLYGFADLRHGLTELFGRPVDLVSRRGVERSGNWIRRRAMLATTETIYVAG